MADAAMAPPRIARWSAIVAGALLAAMLAACGVKYATVRTDKGEDLMLLGHDPVAYFTVGKPVRGYPNINAQFRGATYYFASEQHRRLFVADPARYEPQYGGFCADGAAYGVKLGSDPTEFAIYQGRLFIFGDVVGREFWKLRPAWDVEKGDLMWPETGARGHVVQSLYRLTVRVPWYKTGKEIMDEWRAAHPASASISTPAACSRTCFSSTPVGARAKAGSNPRSAFPAWIRARLRVRGK